MIAARECCQRTANRKHRKKRPKRVVGDVGHLMREEGFPFFRIEADQHPFGDHKRRLRQAARPRADLRGIWPQHQFADARQSNSHPLQQRNGAFVGHKRRLRPAEQIERRPHWKAHPQKRGEPSQSGNCWLLMGQDSGPAVNQTNSGRFAMAAASIATQNNRVQLPPASRHLPPTGKDIDGRRNQPSQSGIE